jgi:hypothetical protein
VFLIATASINDLSSRFSPGKMRIAVTCLLFCGLAIFDGKRIVGVVFSKPGEQVVTSPRQAPFPLMDPRASVKQREDLRTFIAERGRWLEFLRKQPGKHLVLVRYGPHHNAFCEWVYNDADIDRSHIVWARSMPGGKDEELLRYYADRHVWVLDEDQ